jgi:hypothetical protein
METRRNIVNKLSRKAVSIAAGTVLLISAAGVAYAYWTNAGAGAGTAGTGTSVGVTIVQTSTPVGLAPGAPSQPLDFTVTNPGTGSVQISGVLIAFATTGGCVAADFTITQPTFSAVTILPGASKTFTSGAGGAVAATNAAIQMVDSLVNQDSCKSLAVNLDYTSS